MTPLVTSDASPHSILYRAFDSHGQTIDFLLSAKRDAEAATRFSAKHSGSRTRRTHGPSQ
ncbi:DDE-type integrase/transposase/recombinase [Belnapia sp. T18]|uniref:DDE-type integrase/transposase/recombinase n=1 Tax=Belnapia arida TaxID=2804533 RepID=A0ABS1UAF3_9PROT|nr:DDE-type integrase/transposase/recombinase [Belnapia arida]